MFTPYAKLVILSLGRQYTQTPLSGRRITSQARYPASLFYQRTGHIERPDNEYGGKELNQLFMFRYLVHQITGLECIHREIRTHDLSNAKDKTNKTLRLRHAKLFQGSDVCLFKQISN